MTEILNITNLFGKKALITGATGHLGSAFAKTLASLGVSLILVDKPGSDFKSLIASIGQAGEIGIQTFICDFEIEENIIELVEQIKVSSEFLNIVINNAAFVGDTELDDWNTEFKNQSTSTWRRALEVNVTSVFTLVRELTPILERSDNASVINIGSIYGTFGPDLRLYEGTNIFNPAAYSVSKSGLIHLTRWLAMNLAPKVRVNTISPGGIFRNQDPTFVARYIKNTPMARMATEEDLQGLLIFLVSDSSSYVTGQNISVDGGWGIS